MEEQLPEVAKLGRHLVRKMKGRESFQKKRELKSNAEKPTDNYD